VTSLSNDVVLRRRLSAQRFIDRLPDATQVVRATCGIQAQEPLAAALSIRARSRGLLVADVERARVQERSVVRTWGLRGTFHLLATEDLPWLLPLLGPVFIAANRRRRAELGLDEDTCMRGIRIMRDILASRGPLTRAELVEHLATCGLRIEGQARPHLLQRAALEGVICLGPDRGTEPTYVLLRDWVDLPQAGCSFSQEKAVVELALRYLQAYGPATPEDMAAWSGLPMSWIRAAWQEIAHQLMEVEIEHRPAWEIKSSSLHLEQPLAVASVVRLLPRYDTYLLGYQKRDLMMPALYARRVNAGGGIVHPTLLVDGRIVGTWKSKQQKSRLDVTIEPFEPLAPAVSPELEAEISDLARFLDLEVKLHIVTEYQ